MSGRLNSNYGIVKIMRRGSKMTETQKEKLSNIDKIKAMKGKYAGQNNYFYGKHFTGSQNPNYGKPRSEETKAKISEALSGRKLSAEAIETIRQKLLGQKRSTATRKKISKNHADVSGKNNPNFGKHTVNISVLWKYLTNLSNNRRN
jgi:hypothetical protein